MWRVHTRHLRTGGTRGAAHHVWQVFLAALHAHRPVLQHTSVRPKSTNALTQRPMLTLLLHCM